MKRKTRNRKAHNRKTGQRTPSGQLSRAKSARSAAEARKQAHLDMSEREAIEVGIRQRCRRLKIDDHAARDQRMGTAQGRLYMAGTIDQDQYEAAEWFLALRNEYNGAIHSPEYVANRPEGITPSMDPDAYERWAARAIERWNDIERAICDLISQTGRRSILGAIDLVLVRQNETAEKDDAIVGDLRVALNALSALRIRGKRHRTQGRAA